MYLVGCYVLVRLEDSISVILNCIVVRFSFKIKGFRVDFIFLIFINKFIEVFFFEDLYKVGFWVINLSIWFVNIK